MEGEIEHMHHHELSKREISKFGSKHNNSRDPVVNECAYKQLCLIDRHENV